MTSGSLLKRRLARVPQRSSAGYSREVVLLGCFGLMLVFLALTAFVSRMYHKDIHVLADQWFAKGEASFRAGRPGDAAKDYRNALVFSPGNPVFQLHLAQALIAAGEYEQARSYLLNLLAESPGSGEINLALARIAARDARHGESVQDALRCYYGAIYGVWNSDPLARRWDVRRELCEYLLGRRMLNQAQPEIMALAQDVPPGDTKLQKQAAALLLRVSLWDHALDEYRTILVAHKWDPEALAGAGTAAFEMGHYAEAIRYLEALPELKRTSLGVSADLDIARQAQAQDPFLPRLSPRERAERVARAMGQAQGLLETCASRAGGSSLSSLEQLESAFKANQQAWTKLSLTRNPALVGEAVNWVFEVERTASQACGQPSDVGNRALLLLSESHPRSES
ncbi:MAG TPA: tetratricopeptide repeat protein [Candidatus Cybelea sp.]|nr:tetratricopeptide repeat protein [Candidatus Cybelea sp.]